MRSLAFGLLTGFLCACGDAEVPTAPARTWSSVRIQGVETLSDFAILGDELFAVREDNDRALYHVDLHKLQHRGEVQARKLELLVHQTSQIGGSDAFAHQGYQIKHVWPLPVAFVGIAVRPPNRVYLAERHHRLIYWGELIRGADRRLSGARLDFVYSLRGGDRSKAPQSDWRDHGPGLGTMSALHSDQRVEDLYVIDHDGSTPETVGLRRLDRTAGQLGMTVPITDAKGARPDLRGLVWEPQAQRNLALVGGGRGALIPFKDSNLRTVHLGIGTPGPKIDGVSGWTAMALGDDGTLFVLSEGTPPILAWRAPEPAPPTSNR